MTAFGNEPMRRVAKKVLTQYAGPAAGAEAVAAAARRAYDDIARVSAPLIGQVGVDALTSRALQLARREYPWLAHADEPDQSEEPFRPFSVCLERQDPAIA